MGIQPIDLQTLYAQLEKVGKAQGQQQAAQQLLREEEQARSRKEAEERLRTVGETAAGNEGAGKVHERNGSSPQASGDSSQREKNNEDETGKREESEKEVLRDPSLGSIIDISG